MARDRADRFRPAASDVPAVEALNASGGMMWDECPLAGRMVRLGAISVCPHTEALAPRRRPAFAAHLRPRGGRRRAGGGNRTRTAVRPRDFKSRASASSATPARTHSRRSFSISAAGVRNGLEIRDRLTLHRRTRSSFSAIVAGIKTSSAPAVALTRADRTFEARNCQSAPTK